MAAKQKQWKALGLNLAGVSYDAPGVVRNFAQRSNIRYPLLADPDIKMIKAFGVVEFPNKKKSNARPAAFLIDPKGIIQAVYLDTKAVRTPLEFHLLLFGGPKKEHIKAVKTGKRVGLQLWASTSRVKDRDKVLLGIEVMLKPGVKIGASGIQANLKGVTWDLKPGQGFTIAEPIYPPSRKAGIPKTDTEVRVYDTSIRIVRVLTVRRAKSDKQTKLVIEGSFTYQVYDKNQVYPPVSVPVKWEF